jgi:hypothetical protein
MTLDDYIRSLKDWRGATLIELRKLVRQAAPECAESIKWGQPVFDHNGPFAHMKAFKSHVNFGFWRGAELANPKGILKGTGSRMRHVELRSLADIDAPALQSMVRASGPGGLRAMAPSRPGGSLAGRRPGPCGPRCSLPC